MLLASRPAAPRLTIGSEADVPGDAVWLDLIDPTDEERQAAERATGLRVPRQEEIAEIESSSRLRMEGEALYLSMPVVAPGPGGVRALTPLGFVLSPRYLLTLRYAKLPVFDNFAQTLASGKASRFSCDLFVGLLEAIVDRLADLLEHVGADLEALSKRIFHNDQETDHQAKEETKQLRATLRRIGLAGDLASSLRASLLGVGRIVTYVSETTAWVPGELAPRLKSLRQDIVSLADYDALLANKVQFLLDATLGFLNIEQNDGLKILTVVSVVGIPPTLIASMYGMNFKNMPELQWNLGYPYGLAMIALSIVLPLVWFRRKGWL